MKITFILFALCFIIGLGCAVRIRQDKRHILINRPKIDTFGPREKRSPWPRAGVKEQRPMPSPPISLESLVTKGEYVCGNKICKLTPGVEPPGCNGICQYPLKR